MVGEDRIARTASVLKREEAPWESGGWLAKSWDSSSSTIDLQGFFDDKNINPLYDICILSIFFGLSLNSFNGFVFSWQKFLFLW